jgi:hypothetical protein
VDAVSPAGSPRGGVYVDPSANATADMETLLAGNQASKDGNDLWGTLTIRP